MQLLARQDIEAVHLGADAVMLEKPIPVEQIPGFLEGVVSVQDYGAQMAAHLLALQLPQSSKGLQICMRSAWWQNGAHFRVVR